MKRHWIALFFVAATLLLSVGGPALSPLASLKVNFAEVARAQGPAPQGTVEAQAPLGTTFTYQGQLRNAGGPVNGLCDFQFSLWNAAGSGSPPTGGTQLGSLQTINNVTISNGLFNVTLNGGGEFGANAFTGDERRLNIAVRCPAGSGSYTALTPRQALMAVPYAHSLRPGATINGLNNTGNLSFGNTTRQMLNLWGTQYGLGVQNSTLYYRTNSGGGFGWYEGGTHDNAPGSPGFLGLTQMRLNSSGLTVNGQVSASVTSASPGAAVVGSNAGSGYGIYGQSNSGSGVIGDSDMSHGVLGTSRGIYMSGVYGINTTIGYGVTGISNCTSGGELANCIGVNGESNSGAGVVGTGRPGVRAISRNSNPIEAYGSSDNDPEFYVSNTGNVFADGTFNPGGADFAEMLPAQSGLEPGDVLVIGSDGKLTNSTQAYQPTVVGVYSSQPGFLGGAGEEADLTGKIPLAVLGVVPVKVTAENGAIQPGDLLVASSTAGRAMKASQNPSVGTVIGKAIGSLARGTGMIQMLVILQ